jgi:hypothetical protein
MTAKFVTKEYKNPWKKNRRKEEHLGKSLRNYCGNCRGYYLCRRAEQTPEPPPLTALLKTAIKQREK